jgi:hypothetical protein
MKAIKSLSIFMLLFIVLASGCQGSTTSHVDPDRVNTLDFPDQDDQYTFFKPIASFLSMAESNDGYYFFSGIQEQFLYFIDKKNMKATILCAKPDCLHSDEPDPTRIADCNAFFMQPEEMIYYDSYLYIFEKNASMLVQVSLDGMSRKVLYKFKEWPQYATIHRGYLYYSTSDSGTVNGDESKTETKCKLLRLDLGNTGKEPEVIFEYSSIYADITRTTGYNDTILFSTSSYNDSSMQTRKNTLLSYNIPSRSINEIGKDIGGYSINGNKIVFFWDDCIYSCNFDGTDRKIVPQANGFLYSDNKYMLVDTIFLKDEYGNKAKRRLDVFDLNGKKISSIELNNVGREIMYGGDSDYLFFPDSSRKNKFGVIYTLWAIDKHKLADGTAKPFKVFEFVPKVEDKGVVTKIG